MTDRHITRLMDEYLLGSLEPAARESVEAHLAGCRFCRTALDAALDASDVMRWLPNPQTAPVPGPDFYYRVQAAIEKEQSRSWLLRWTAGLQPRFAFPLVMMGLLLLAWMVSVPRRGAAGTPLAADGWREVEYPAADIASMAYTDDWDDAVQDRMMNNIFDAAEVD